MPRKSAVLRLAQAQELYTSYREANIEEMKSGYFIRDMISKLEIGKGLSKGQRNWLDSLIDEGVPQPKGDQVLLAKIESAISTLGMESKAGVLSDFRRKVFNGWDLSIKQSKWLDDLLSQAQELRISGPWKPNEELVFMMRDIASLSRGYSTVYWQTHGGTYRAVEKIRNYLQVIDADCEDEDLRAKELAKVGLDEWCINKAKKAMAGRIRELRDNPYVKEGDLVWTRYQANEQSWPKLQWFRAPVCGAPEVSERGEVVYPVLNPVLGLILVSKEKLQKRKPREQ